MALLDILTATPHPPTTPPRGGVQGTENAKNDENKSDLINPTRNKPGPKPSKRTTQDYIDLRKPSSFVPKMLPLHTRKAATRDLARRAREATLDGAMVIEDLMRLRAGLPPEPVYTTDKETGERIVLPSAYDVPSAEVRYKSTMALKLIGWGREPLIVEGTMDHNHEVKLDVTKWNAEETRAYLELVRKARSGDVVDGEYTPAVLSAHAIGVGDGTQNGDGLSDSRLPETGSDLRSSVGAGAGIGDGAAQAND